jgi:hypothetical protein
VLVIGQQAGRVEKEGKLTEREREREKFGEQSGLGKFFASGIRDVLGSSKWLSYFSSLWL